MEYKFNTPISQIQLSNDGKRATGIVFQDKSQPPLEADVVICNADLTYAYNNLLPTTSYAKSLLKREPSCSSISFYWALDRQFHELSAHNIFLAEDYQESFDSIFKKLQIPDQPSFYVNVPSRVDPSAAPEGCDAIVVLVPVGHLLDSESNAHNGAQGSAGTSQDWDAMVAAARRTILHTIEARLQISLGPHIIDEYINTPPTWKTAFNLDRGAILGLSHSFFNVLSFRPKTKHPTINDLFFVGASTHPGTGVPIVLAGAKLVAEQIMGEMRQKGRMLRAFGSSKEGKKEKSSPLDRVQDRTYLKWLQWAFFLLVAVLLMRAQGQWGARGTNML